MSSEEWIKNLKVGDKVVVATGSYGRRITTVTKITPKGFINIESGQQFTQDGHQRGGDTWHRAYLSELTDAVRLEFKKNSLVQKCKEINFEKLSIEQLEQILLISKEGE